MGGHELAQSGDWGPVPFLSNCHPSSLGLGAQVENEGLLSRCPPMRWWLPLVEIPPLLQVQTLERPILVD